MKKLLLSLTLLPTMIFANSEFDAGTLTLKMGQKIETPIKFKYYYNKSKPGYWIEDNNARLLFGPEIRDDARYGIRLYVEYHAKTGQINKQILWEQIYPYVYNEPFVKWQGDGNLVFYLLGNDGLEYSLWASNTSTSTGYKGYSVPINNAYLSLQTDGNLVIYDGNNNPLWSTATANEQGNSCHTTNTQACYIYPRD